MALPPSLTTVTPISKFLAMLLFVTLPFVSFYLGMQYGKMSFTSTAYLTKNKLLSSTSPISKESTSSQPEYVVLTNCTAESPLAKVSLHPARGWTCSMLQNTPGNYSLQLIRNNITIQISDFGRDNYCTNDDPKCVITSFFKNGNMNLKLYTYNGFGKEIFGIFPEQDRKHRYAGHISIRSTASLTELSDTEKQEIYILLNTLTYSLKLN